MLDVKEEIKKIKTKCTFQNQDVQSQINYEFRPKSVSYENKHEHLFLNHV